jgi:hypothetical protein
MEFTEFNNTCSIYDETSYDYTYIIALYTSIIFLGKYYSYYFKNMNFEYDSDDVYNGVLCI